VKSLVKVEEFRGKLRKEEKQQNPLLKRGSVHCEWDRKVLPGRI
jgi:hypothetical protein